MRFCAIGSRLLSRGPLKRLSRCGGVEFRGNATMGCLQEGNKGMLVNVFREWCGEWFRE